MESVLESLPEYLAGFRMTLYLTVVSGVLSLLLGTFLAACRVSPLKSLRTVATVIVEVGRNTPLTLVFVFFVFILPALGVILPLGTIPAIIALTVYTSAFVCEAVRSGINSVGIGQAATLAGTGPLARRSSRSRLMIVALVAVLVAIGGTVAAALYSGHSRENDEPSTAIIAEASPVKAVPAPEPLAAPEPEVAPVAPEPVDEIPAALPPVERKAKTAAPSRKRRARPKPQPSGKPGTVNLVTRGGWAEVFKDGKSVGSTPRRLTLPAGRHKLVLKRSGNGPPKRVFVDVEADTIKQVSIRLD